MRSWIAPLPSRGGRPSTNSGNDAAGPAAFLALLWPRLHHRDQRAVAIVGAAIAVALVPLAPPGVPILAAMLAVFAAPLASHSRSTSSSGDHGRDDQ